METEFADQTFVLLPELAAYWARQDALLIADLHVGKAEAFQARGHPMPSGHHRHDLQKLSGLVERIAPGQLFILGDLFHAKAGLSGSLVEEIKRALEALDCEVSILVGNHDRRVEDALELLGVGVYPELELDGIRLRHAPLDDSTPHICGHMHPRAVLNLDGGFHKFPCFLLQPQRLVLPAFGSFTDGMSVPRREGSRRFIAVAETVLEV